MSREFPVKGLEELDRFLSALPKNMQTAAYRSGLTAAAGVIRDEARARAPRKSGLMARAIRSGSPRRNEDGSFSISVGVPFDQAKWFRGRETTARAESRCPDESCCKRPTAGLSEHWAGKAWPSARLHAHILSPLPSGSFPGVDDSDVYAFLEAHSQS